MMILYTVLPLEDVLDGIDENPAPTMLLNMGGVTFEVEQLDGFQARIIRLHSTIPEDYLQPQHQPGTIICLNKF